MKAAASCILVNIPPPEPHEFVGSIKHSVRYTPSASLHIGATSSHPTMSQPDPESPEKQGLRC